MDNSTVIERLARIEEKLDGIIFRTVTTEAKVALNETRIRDLEVSQGRLVAGTGVLAFVAGLVGTIFPNFFHH